MYKGNMFPKQSSNWIILICLNSQQIPFSKFFLSSRGRIQDKQAAVDLELVNSVGLTMADAVDGEFALEIDSISASYDATHSEEFAYELYR